MKVIFDYISIESICENCGEHLIMQKNNLQNKNFLLSKLNKMTYVIKCLKCGSIQIEDISNNFPNCENFDPSNE